MATPTINTTNLANLGSGSRVVPGPSTPAPVNNLISTSTPKSHHTPGAGGHGPFASPAHRGTPRPFGTPSKVGMAAFGGKTVGGASGIGGKTISTNADGSFTAGLSGVVTQATPMFTFGASPALNFTSPNASGAGSTNIDALPGFSNSMGSFTGMDGGTGMGISLSSLGINTMVGSTLSTTGSTIGKTDDVERKRKLEIILNSIGQRPGRITREGLERLGRRCGLDTQMGEVDDLAMAGKNMLVDFEFASNHSQSVKHVVVTLATASDALAEHAHKAGKILLGDLTLPPGKPSINVTLDKFADNLERLASMDRLSVPGASCFDAVFGVYTSLKRLYDYEKQTAEKLFGSDKRQKAEMEVMCGKSGFPRMHCGKRVGLALTYWTHGRLLGTHSNDERDHSENIAVPVGTSESSHEGVEEDFAKLVIECEPLPATLYPPIAITSDWISSRVEKPPDEVDITMSGTEGIMADPKATIEWLNPPPPVLPNMDANPLSADGTMSIINPGQPQVRFVARVEPPVILPLHLAAQVYSSVGVDISQDAVTPSTIPSLALPQHFPVVDSIDELPKYLNIKKSITDRSNEQREYKVGLFPTRLELAKSVSNIPFAHPKQLITILPVLRQYCFISRLLQNTFGSSHKLSKSSIEQTDVSLRVGTNAEPYRKPMKMQNKRSQRMELEAELAALLDDGPTHFESARSLDIAFSTTPIPQLTLIMQSPRGPKRITLNVLLNAELDIIEQDVTSHGRSDGAQPRPESQNEAARLDEGGKKAQEAMARALTICEDLIIWTEWMRHRFLEKDID